MELGKNTDDSLKSHLEEWKLDPVFWEPKFKEELEITSSNVLKHVGKRDYEKLKKHVRWDWESNILKKMLGVSVEDSTFEKGRKKHRDKMMKRQEDNKVLLSSLKDLKSQGKDMVDEEVKSKVKQMCAALNLPENAWVQKDLEDLNIVIDKLTNQLDTTALTREELNEREVVLNASSSLALKGVLRSKNNKYIQPKDYNIVLAMPDNINFAAPAINQTTDIHSFTSKASKSNYTKTLETLGYSVAAEAKGGSHGFAFEAGCSISHSEEKEETEEAHSIKTYYGQVKSTFVPVASCKFKMNELLLDENCIKALADLENICGLADEAMKQVECEKFFHEYGSHINHGTMHLGGIYHWKSDYERDVRVKKDTVKNINANALGLFVNLSYLGALGASVDISGTSLKGSFEGNYEEEDLSSMTLQIETTGGPGEAGPLLQWKNGLIANNSTWALIDRGLDFKGIWELLSKHNKRFSDAAEFENLLSTAWEKMFGLESDQNRKKNKKLLKAKDDLDEMINLIKEYVEDDRFVENCKDYVVKICETKHSVLSKTSNEFWRKQFRNKPAVENFLEVVAQHKDHYSEEDIPCIKYNIGRILDGTQGLKYAYKIPLEKWIKKDEEEIKHTESLFRDSKETDMKTFIFEVRNNMLPKLEQSFSLSNGDIDTEQGRVTLQLTYIVKSFILFLNKSKDIYMVKFLTLMLLPLSYDVQAQVFQKYLSIKSLASFINSFELYVESLRMYQNHGVMQVEAYLLHLIIEQVDELLIQSDIKKEDKDVKREDKFQEILNSIKVETKYFSADTKTIIEKYGKPPISWKRFKQEINSRMDGVEFFQESLGSTLAESLVTAANTKTVTQQTVTSCIKLNPEREKEKIIDELGLKQFYPNKLTLTDIRKRPITDLKDLKDLKEVPWIFLDKILMLDYRGRNEMRFPGDDITTNDKSDEFIKHCDESHDNKDEVACIMDQMKFQEEQQPQEKLNPMDVLIAVFLCSNDFLKQLLVKHLVMCRLSIPVVLPDINNECIVQFWPLRGIILEELGKANTAVDQRIPIVSVIRLCNITRSKSDLMNHILNNPSHATFFNKRDCNHGKEERVLSNGLVDATWHIPSSKVKCNCEGKTKCKCFFKSMLMFLNLHGSCHKFQEQTKFICQVSSLILLFVDAHELSDSDAVSSFVEVVSACKKCFLVIANSDQKKFTSRQLMKIPLEVLGQQHCKNIKGFVFDYTKTKLKTYGEIKEDIISNVNDILGCNDVKSLQELHAEQVFELSTNEDGYNCKYGKERAHSMIELVNKSKLGQAKKIYLPLQGDLWKKWGELARKERNKPNLRGNETLELYLSRLYEERKELRRRQLKNEPNELILCFIKNFLTLKADSRLYFIHWITHYLNELSRETLPLLRIKYFKTCSEIQQKKERKDNDAQAHLKKLQEQLKDLQNDLVEASFGWEHLVREIGQIYEASKALESEIVFDLKNNIEILPRTMAELLISGYPIEIMDGNASHVPIVWIQAVFKQLKQLTGNKKVFVLSVLGIQSSGKSTLLNAMFGLQFSVSSGRCTQGVYAQFVSLPNNPKEKYGIDYIMVVDTEGLRAPEFVGDKHNRDNELATLSIGISDLTIINIKGENQTEMHDVLQIVIHAFLRMQMVNKSMKIKSSCLFTHQNVDPADDGNQMKIGQQKLLEKLNSIAEAAATDLNIKDISSFSDIISFDINKDVFNFSNLWQGDPPMAPVNYGYSEKVSLVKRRILSEIIPNKGGQEGHRNKGLSISNLSNRLNDVQNGIIADNFVHSFKNSLEIKAFNALEETYSNLAYELDNSGSEWFNIEAMIKIQNVTDNHERLQINLKDEFNIHITKKFSIVSDSLEKYFSGNEYCGILEQWRANREKRLLEKKHEIILRINYLIQAEIKLRILHASIDTQLDEWTKQISDITTVLAKILQGEDLSQEQLYSRFDKVWTDWLTKFQSKRKSIPGLGINVYNSVYSVLGDVLKTENPLLRSKLIKTQLDNPVVYIRNSFQIQNEHIEKRKAAWYNPFNIGIPNLETCLEEATRTTNEIFDRIEKYLRKIADQIFTKAHAQEILKMFTKFIDKCNADPKGIFHFTADYKVSVLIHTCRFGIPKFNEMHEAYKKKADPSVREEMCRKQLLTQFINIYKKSAIEKTNADLISTYLETQIMEKVNEDIPRKIAEEVRKDNTFMHTTGALQAKILSKFADESRFENFRYYINDTNACLRKALKEYTNEYLFKTVNDEETTYFEYVELKLDSKFNEVRKTIENVTDPEQLKSDKVNMEVWVNNFIDEIKHTIPVRRESLQLINKEVKDSNFSNFKSILVDNLHTSLVALKNCYKKSTVLPEDFEKKVNIQLTKDICTAQCPYCKAPCSRTGSNHGDKHSAIQHYPMGVGGCITDETQELVLDTCTSRVASDPRFSCSATDMELVEYKDYISICTSARYPEWNIQPELSFETSIFWKWFMATYSKDLESMYGRKLTTPPAWSKFTPQDAKYSLIPK